MLLNCIIADMLYIMSGKPIKQLVDEDIKRNLKWDAKGKMLKNNIKKLNYLLLKKTEFRSIFYFRMKHHSILINMSRLLLPCVKTIEFGNGAIEGGMMISHYHCIIFPKKAGKNFRVGPGVVIGRNGDFPTFGDNVYVAANATVIGNIHIGDNVIIGAGSVVTKDLAGNGVYVGNPAYLLKHIDHDDALINEIM